MLRSRTLIAVLVTSLLLALPSGVAIADYGDGGTGTWDPCSFAVCRWVVSGQVTDAATGAPVAGATIALQWRSAGGEWGDPPSAADLRPATNPLTGDAAGRFTWLARGGAGEQVRVVVAHDGYDPATSAARDLRADGTLDVALRPSPVDAPVVLATPETPVVPAAPGGAGPVGGAGGPAAPGPTPPAAVKKGCAAKPTKARAACLRAAALAKALKACKTRKGAKRATCERRARALSACDAKTGRKRAACRAKARAIGQPPKHARR